jgi:hypothetical protein
MTSLFRKRPNNLPHAGSHDIVVCKLTPSCSAAVVSLLMSVTGPGLNVSVKFTTTLFIWYTIIIICLSVRLFLSCVRLFHWCCCLSRALVLPVHLRFCAHFEIGGVNQCRFLLRWITSPSYRIYLRTSRTIRTSHGNKERWCQVFMRQEGFQPALPALQEGQKFLLLLSCNQSDWDAV